MVVATLFFVPAFNCTSFILGLLLILILLCRCSLFRGFACLLGRAQLGVFALEFPLLSQLWVLELLLLALLHLLLVNKLSLLMHLVVVFLHAVLLVNRIYEATVRRLVRLAAAAWVVQCQQRKLGQLNLVVLRMVQQAVTFSHLVDRGPLDLQLFKPLVQVHVTLHAAYIRWLTGLLMDIIHCFCCELRILSWHLRAFIL